MENLLVARFDVYRNAGKQAASTPYLVDVQCDLLEDLDSRIVIPLRSLEHFPDVKLSTRLTPVLTIGAERFLLETPKMGAVPRRFLKNHVASLAHDQEQIVAALDFLFHGY